VVDDRAANRDLLVTLLGYRGHTTLQAGDGAEALQIAQARHPDLVITDLVMPVMDGYELVRKLRAEPGLAATRIIFYTATYLRAEVEQMAESLGVRHIMPKPSEPGVLLATMDEVLAEAVPSPAPAPAEEVREEYRRVVSAKLADKVRALQAAEDSLKASEARFRSLAESSPVGIFSVDQAGQVGYCNPRLLEICGRPESGAVRAWTDLLHAEDREQVLAGLTGVMQAGATYGDRVRIVRSAGDLRWVEIQAAPVLQDSDLGACVGTVEDVTEALHAQLRTQRAEARFRGLLEAAPDAVVAVDGDGFVVLVNAQAERIFGYGREELVGRPVEALVTGAVNAARLAESVPDPRTRRLGEAIQVEGRRCDGSSFPAEVSMSAIDTDDGAIYMAAIRDVTGWRQAQDELERANRNLESFAYSVSHDLRAPLRSLAGFSAALLEECGDSLGVAGRDYAGRIGAASEQMGTLIDDLLQLSRVARAEVRVQELDLGAEVASIAEELARDGPDRLVRFAIERPVWAQADRSLVRTVLENLVGNAWKYTSRRDEAVIEFGTVPGGAADGGDGRVCCFVRDNGAGFDPAYADKLFRPFQRLHAAREFAGTGVGLASVKQIVERHGGQVWARGAVGKGATFYFTLDAKGAR
jgi:PAS domain S-box-containing protein